MGPAPSIAAIGADLGGTKLFVGVVDSEPRILRRSEETSVGLTSDDLLATLERELCAARGAHPEVVAAGVGIPCTIDRERGYAINAVNLPLAGIPIRDRLAERIGLPVSVDNDANLAALAEHRFGAARGAQNAVVLTIGTGIGGGLIIGGEVYRGSTGAGAELGHMVVDAEGPSCQGNCPNRGCAEAVASGTALGREGTEAAAEHPGSALGQALASGERIDGRAVTAAALAGDDVARDVVTTIGRRLGAFMSGLANVFEPDVIVVGGGAMALGELLLEPARAELRARALPPMNETPVRAAELGPEAGMIGAAALAMSEAGVEVAS